MSPFTNDTIQVIASRDGFCLFHFVRHGYPQKNFKVHLPNAFALSKKLPLFYNRVVYYLFMYSASAVADSKANSKT